MAAYTYHFFARMGQYNLPDRALAVTFAGANKPDLYSWLKAGINIIALKPTNQYIAEHALRLFNKSGVVNVRLQHIADAAFVSVGHLAYHFKNKEALVEYLFEQHKRESEQLLQTYRIMPLFADVDRMFCALYLMQEKYSFLYKDVLELVRAYPQMAGRFAAYSSWQQMQLTLMVDFQLARGALFLPNRYVSAADIAVLLQRHLAQWHYRQAALQDVPFSFDQFSTDAWQVLLPFCTQLGLQELQVA